MSETKHSPEPWVVFDAKYPGIDADNGEGVVFHSQDGDGHTGIWGGIDGSTSPAANARRIVACVNACAGVPTEALESGALAKALDAASLALSGVNEDIDNRYTLRGSTCGLTLQALHALRALGRLKP